MKFFNFTEISVKKEIIFVIFTLCILLFYNNIGSIELSKRIYTNPFFFITSSISGFFLCFFIASFIVKNKILKIIFLYLGKNTIPIIGLHFLAFRFITYLLIIIYKLPIKKLSSYPILKIDVKENKFFFIFYFIAGILIPLLLNFLYKEFISLIQNIKEE